MFFYFYVLYVCVEIAIPKLTTATRRILRRCPKLKINPLISNT